MKALAKFLMAIVLVFLAVVVVVGPGGVVAGAEYPFGIGPWSSTGRYCHNIYEMTHFVAVWHHSDQSTLTDRQKATWLAYEKTLTKTGPQVPRADFSVWYQNTGNGAKTMEKETSPINKWWNQNCTDPMMEAPATVSHVWLGLRSHATFEHYPKNVIRLQNFDQRILKNGT
jgi:hypothetical protein